MSGVRIPSLCLFAALVGVPGRAQLPDGTLASLRDRARPILIFGAANDARVAQQLGELTGNASALRERDVQVVLVTDGSLPQPSGVPVSALPPTEQAGVYRRFHVAPGSFRVVLVGKDGGEKMQSTKPVPWQTFAATIDGMPMRRNEMKQR